MTARKRNVELDELKKAGKDAAETLDGLRKKEGASGMFIADVERIKKAYDDRMLEIIYDEKG